MPKDDFRERILSAASELALDLSVEHFIPGRISAMVKNGHITIDEIVEAFKTSLKEALNDEYDYTKLSTQKEKLK